MRGGSRATGWHRVGPVLAALAIATTAWVAGADELEVQAALREWSDDPLDLTTATADEIALLPWVSGLEAVAIRTLAAMGELHRLEDLDRIPGFTVEQRDALAPYVRIATPASARVARWEFSRQMRHSDGSARTSTRLWARTDRWSAGLRGSRGDDLRLAYLGLQASHWELGWGRWRPRSSSALLLAESTARTRSAPLPRRAAFGPRVSPSLSSQSAERAWTWGWHGELWRWRVYGDPQGGTRFWSELARVRGESCWALAVARSSVGTIEWMGQWRRRRGSLTTRWDLAGAPGALRSFVHLAWDRPRSQFAISMTKSAQPTVNARDPITMNRLDRPHLSTQFDLRLSDDRWRLAGFLRRVERDGSSVHRVRAWIEPRHRRSDAWRWQLRGGLDEAPTSDPGQESASSSVDFDVHLSCWRSEAARSRRLRLWWRGQRGASARALALDLRRGRRWELRATFVAAAGTRSMPWAAGLPAGALRLRWLSPGEGLILVGVARRWRRGGVRAEMGAWALAAADGHAPAAFESGWAIQVRR